jgi:hypothetical protein
MREGSSANHHAAKSASEKNTQGATYCQPIQINPPALAFFLFFFWCRELNVLLSLDSPFSFLFYFFLFTAERLKLYGLQVQQPTSQEDESLFVSLSIQVVAPPRCSPDLPPLAPSGLLGSYPACWHAFGGGG